MPAAERTREPDALRYSLLSTHLLLRGRAAEPSSRRWRSEGELGEAVQAATQRQHLAGAGDAGDDAVLGAAIFLPDHPEVAPESLGNLFDNTEIEEALLLHVKTLSDAEREQIAGQDPAVLEMIERAERATPERGDARAARPAPYPSMRDAARRGTTRSRARRRPGRRTYPARRHRRPAPGDRNGGVLDMILAGRSATIERIYLDYDDRIHLGVTVDDDPGQDLMRDSGRYLFFFGDEVEVTRVKEIEKQILVAGVGNALLSDDGFGGHVVAAARAARSCPSG